jgi:transcriptional regulator with XRE-family HTH domain
MNRLIGVKVKELRQSHNYSQEEVADMLNVSQATYSRIENGSSSAWVNYLDRLSSIYNIQSDEFLRLEEILPKSANQDSDLVNKIIEQYEIRIVEKDKIIDDLRKKMDILIRKLT